MSRSTEPTACDRVLDLLEPFVDGEVTAEEQALVRAHLERCPACAREVSLARRIQRELKAMPQPELPPRLAEDLLDSARAPRPREAGSAPASDLRASGPRSRGPVSEMEPSEESRLRFGPSARRSTPAGEPWRWAAWGGLAAALATALFLVLWTAPFDPPPRLVVEQTIPSPAEIERAEAEARFALAQVAAVSRRAGLELRDGVLGPHLVRPMTRNLTDSLRNVPDVAETPDRSTGDDA